MLYAKGINDIIDIKKSGILYVKDAFKKLYQKKYINIKVAIIQVHQGDIQLIKQIIAKNIYQKIFFENETSTLDSKFFKLTKSRKNKIIKRTQINFLRKSTSIKNAEYPHINQKNRAKKVNKNHSLKVTLLSHFICLNIHPEIQSVVNFIVQIAIWNGKIVIKYEKMIIHQPHHHNTPKYPAKKEAKNEKKCIKSIVNYLNFLNII